MKDNAQPLFHFRAKMQWLSMIHCTNLTRGCTCCFQGGTTLRDRQGPSIPLVCLTNYLKNYDRTDYIHMNMTYTHKSALCIRHFAASCILAAFSGVDAFRTNFQDDKTLQCCHSLLYWPIFWTKHVCQTLSAETGIVCMFGSSYASRPPISSNLVSTKRVH